MVDREIYIDLYHEDRKVRFLEKRLKEIPDALKGLGRESRRAEETRKARVAEVEALEVAARRLERELEAERSRLKKLVERQKQVTSVEAMEAGERDIARLRESCETMETAILAKLEDLEVRARQDRLRQPAEADDDSELARETAELKTEFLECESELAAANAARERLLARLPERERRRYDRLHASCGHSVIAALHGGACGHCGEKLPPQQVVDIRDKGELQPCQGCGRLVLEVSE